MKNARIIISMIVVIGAYCFNLPQVMGAIIYDDGLTHDISSDLHNQLEVKDSFLGGITKVNLLPGGIISNLTVWGNSQVNISGGEVNNQIVAYGSSIISISSGGIPSGQSLLANNSSNIFLSGGRIGGSLHAYNSSNVYISGGTVDGKIRASNSSVITFSGSNFIFGGVNVEPGTFTTPTAAPVTAPLSFISSSGEPLSYIVLFEKDTSIVLVPEPCTLSTLLLGLGGLALRRKKHNLT